MYPYVKVWISQTGSSSGGLEASNGGEELAHLRNPHLRKTQKRWKTLRPSRVDLCNHQVVDFEKNDQPCIQIFGILTDNFNRKNMIEIMIFKIGKSMHRYTNVTTCGFFCRDLI